MINSVQCTALILWRPRASYVTALSTNQPAGPYEATGSSDIGQDVPLARSFETISRLTPLSFFPHQLPWLRAAMASGTHGLFPASPLPQHISSTAPLRSTLPAHPPDLLESSNSTEAEPNRAPPNRQEQLMMLTEASDPRASQGGLVAARTVISHSVAPEPLSGQPIVKDISGREERNTMSAEVGETAVSEEEEEVREGEKEGGVLRDEEVDVSEAQDESVENAGEIGRTDGGDVVEDVVSVKEGVRPELREETEAIVKSEQDRGAEVETGATDLEKVQEGERQESDETRDVRTAEKGEDVEPEAHQQISNIASAGNREEQLLVDEVKSAVDLSDNNADSSFLPHTVNALEPLNPGMDGEETGRKDVERETSGDVKAEDEKRETAVRASSDPVMPRPTPDISFTSHIAPDSASVSVEQISTEEGDDLSPELPTSQESNGSLDILCSSPIASQEDDKVGAELIREDEDAQLDPLTKSSTDMPEEDDTANESLIIKDPVESAEEEEEEPEPPLPRPSFSRFAQPAPVLAKRTLKRKDTMQDLFSAMVPLKRKKVELTRKPAVLDQANSEAASMEKEKGEEETGAEEKDDDLAPDPPAEDVMTEDTTRDDVSLAPVPGQAAADVEEDPKKGQWRVGRLPGHQGSHIKREADGVSDPEDNGKRLQKRSLGQSINDSAERVLKKPFRLPARVVLKPASSRAKTPPATSAPPSSSPLPSNPNSSSPSSSQTQTSGPTRSKTSSRPFSVPRKIDRTPIKPSFPTRTSTPVFLPTPQSESTTSTVRSSPFKSSPTFSKRLAKPFKTPFSRSTAPSPISSTSRIKTPSTRELIAELEKEERTLTQAIKYYTEPEEDERLVELITTWRDAGQQVAELLFTVYPRPDPEAANGGEGIKNKPFGMFQDDRSFFATSEYTPEQLRYIANLDTNADGDPVDNDGIPIFGNGGGDMAMDIEGILEQRGKEVDPDRDEGRRTSKETDSTDWTIGTMLVKLGVDPAMYVWDADAEDWGNPEEE